MVISFCVTAMEACGIGSTEHRLTYDRTKRSRISKQARGDATLIRKIEGSMSLCGHSRRREHRRPVATVTATQLGVHLGITRQRIAALADVEHVIERLPDGRFD